jgi:2-iminoacetate synthase
VAVLAGKIGHKRLIVVYGEHPKNDVDYVVKSLQTIYSVRVKTRNGHGSIRRVNVNAPPFSIEDLKSINEAGIGTYQVFQETYHRGMYAQMHPADTIKGNFRWRLYCMHRAMEAGIDDVGIGALFGLYDWRFELMALIAHSQELERKLGIGGTRRRRRWSGAESSAQQQHGDEVIDEPQANRPTRENAEAFGQPLIDRAGRFAVALFCAH